MKERLKRLLLRSGIRIGKVTEKKRLLEFISSVRPVTTNYALIRVGGTGDGGYLLPDDLDGVEACFSPGVSDRAEFENDLTKRSIRCFLADYSVDAPPIDNALFDFEKKYLGPKETSDYVTLESWISRKAASGDMVLQMDIEGAEYGVIFDTSASVLKRFRILVIEFHGLDKLFDPLGFELISLAFTKILKDFDVVHIHPNNCFPPVECMNIAVPPMMEFTFLRRDRITAKRGPVEYPHPLDQKCVAENVDVVLPRCWFRAD